MFSTLAKQISIFQQNLNLSSANAFNSDQSKKLWCGKELRQKDIEVFTLKTDVKHVTSLGVANFNPRATI